MHYTIYKITNKLNGKFYIGKHQTKDLNDGYMGSGKILKRAIEKHGMDNFQKEILFIFDNEQEMNDKEKELVTLHEMSYNLCPGGKGGFGYINGNLPNGMLGKTQSEKQKTIAKELMTSRNKDKKFIEENRQRLIGRIGSFRGKTHSEKTKKQMSEKAKGRVPWNKGIPRTEKEKENIRNGLKPRQSE